MSLVFTQWVKRFFWLKSLHQLGFVCFFGFYFWIGLLVAESDPKQK
ncbi:hypothetical protein [uncultured Gammaproteobacteria bacterium]|nr:hypothetical protein [uncultured Gammaproteobacteria bacterium]